MNDSSQPTAAVTHLLSAHHRFDLKYRLGDLRECAVPGSILFRLTGSRLLVTAPHSVTHLRNGREKLAEFWTGSIAETIGAVTGANVITSLSPRIEDDTAATNDHFFKAVVFSIQSGARVVVDLHGMSDQLGVDIVVGDCGLESAKGIDMLEELLSRRFSVALNMHFRGRQGIGGLVNRSNMVDTHAIQLELGTRFRSDITAISDIQYLAEALASFAEVEK